MRLTPAGALALLFAASPVRAQQGFTDAFPPGEFATRRAAVIAQIGDGVGILQSTTERRGESPLRQSNQFFYLTGVTEPRAFVVIDGRSRQTTLFLTPATPRRRAIGPYLDVNEECRKRKLRDKQKEGSVDIPQEAFLAVLKVDE